MDTNDTNPLQPQISPDGGVIMAAEPPPPPPPLPQETVIIPPPSGIGVSGSVSPQGSYVPNLVVPPAGMGAGNPSQSGSSTGFLRKLLVYGGAFVFLLAIVLFVRSLVTKVAQPKEVTITYWGLWENDTTVRGMISEFEANRAQITSPKCFPS